MTMLHFSLNVVKFYPAAINLTMQRLLDRSLFVIKFCSTLRHDIFRLGSNLLGSSHSFTRKKRLRQQAVPAALCSIICARRFFLVCVIIASILLYERYRRVRVSSLWRSCLLNIGVRYHPPSSTLLALIGASAIAFNKYPHKPYIFWKLNSFRLLLIPFKK